MGLSKIRENMQEKSRIQESSKKGIEARLELSTKKAELDSVKSRILENETKKVAQQKELVPLREEKIPSVEEEHDALRAEKDGLQKMQILIKDWAAKCKLCKEKDHFRTLDGADGDLEKVK